MLVLCGGEKDIAVFVISENTSVLIGLGEGNEGELSAHLIWVRARSWTPLLAADDISRLMDEYCGKTYMALQ